MRYYIAYGSNLNVQQMNRRCPGAKIAGTAVIRNYELLFKGSKTGSYLTIEKSKGSFVPVAIWEVTAEDEKALDRYEGYPVFYYKKDMKIRCKSIISGKSREIDAFVYIMHEKNPAGVPSLYYINTCACGYEYFDFDYGLLRKAYHKSRKAVLGNER